MDFERYKSVLKRMVSRGETTEANVERNLTEPLLKNAKYYSARRTFKITEAYRAKLKQTYHKSNTRYIIDGFACDSNKNYMIFEDKRLGTKIEHQKYTDQIHNYAVVMSNSYNVTCAALSNGEQIHIYKASSEGLDNLIYELDLNNENHFNRFQRLLKSNDFTFNNLVKILRYDG